MVENVNGIEYIKPEVLILHDTGIGVAEFAARTAYDSFDKSENDSVKELHDILLKNELTIEKTKDISLRNVINEVKNIENSKLLDDLAWTYFHHSVLEHTNISFYVKNISRGVLQELARHRIASYTVRSTRYTMGDIINAFIAVKYNYLNLDDETAFKEFSNLLNNIKFLIVKNNNYKEIEYRSIFDKLSIQLEAIGRQDFLILSTSKDMRDNGSLEKENIEEIYKSLILSKQKRNVGDPFKHIVSDNWAVELVMTYNLRSLKNFFTLRDSGSAYFQIRWLAEEIKKQTPIKYLKLIDKKFKTN